MSPLVDDVQTPFLSERTISFEPTTYNDCQYPPSWADKTLLDQDCYYINKGFPPPIHLRSYRFVWTKPDSPTALESAASNSDARNNLKDVLVGRSDVICDATKGQIAGTKNWINFGLGETTSVLGGVGAIVTAVTPARVLSGMAGISNASRAQVNETFYQNAVKVAIMQKIDELRVKKLEDFTKRSALPLEKYSVQAMLFDVTDYHDRCSFSIAVENLGNNTPKAEITPPTVQPKPNVNASATPKGRPTSGGGTGLSLAPAQDHKPSPAAH